MLWPKKGAFENVNDLKEQAFYRFIAKTYWGHIALQFAVLYAIGGWPWFVWLGCIRVCHHQQTMCSVGTCLPALFETNGSIDLLMCNLGHLINCLCRLCASTGDCCMTSCIYSLHYVSFVFCVFSLLPTLRLQACILIGVHLLVESLSGHALSACNQVSCHKMP